MAYMCLEAEECRVFIKNGKLRFQARKVSEEGKTLEQITVSFPKEMAYCFSQVADLDELNNQDTREEQIFQSRIKNYFTEENG